jgi:ribosomal protein S18 acetylase RimI-like enzyme
MMRIESDPGSAVRLMDDDHVLGRATWVVTDAGEGLIQILSITIDPAHQRRGHGKRLLHGLYDHARAELAGPPLRRAWIATANKSHVIARAFLTGEGFHHVGSNGGIYRDQDVLIYVKSFD